MSDPRKLWRDQELSPVGLDQLDEFRNRIDRRNKTEYLAAAAVVVVFLAYAMIFDHPLLKLGSLLTAAGAVVVAINLHRRASARRPGAAEAALPCVEHLRAELMRQQSALQSVWKWYVLPLVPGVAVFLAGLAMVLPHPAFSIVGIAAGACLLAAWVIKANQTAAHRIAEELRDIDKMRRV
jgi:hypothetical protein